MSKSNAKSKRTPTSTLVRVKHARYDSVPHQKATTLTGAFVDDRRVASGRTSTSDEDAIDFEAVDDPEAAAEEAAKEAALKDGIDLNTTYATIRGADGTEYLYPEDKLAEMVDRGEIKLTGEWKYEGGETSFFTCYMVGDVCDSSPSFQHDRPLQLRILRSLTFAKVTLR